MAYGRSWPSVRLRPGMNRSLHWLQGCLGDHCCAYARTAKPLPAYQGTDGGQGTAIAVAVNMPPTSARELP